MTTEEAVTTIRDEAAGIERRGIPHYKALSWATDYFVLRHDPDIDDLRVIETALYADETAAVVRQEQLRSDWRAHLAGGGHKDWARFVRERAGA